ncbi:HNH endonuclease signature motif containing protein [Streptomyces goshikiensis]|uniref:HNH endonuclease signature motif containing protein n=1 Tax=Streptomyces goshikiensis TaxID=1942 RepID=UPI00364E24AD
MHYRHRKEGKEFTPIRSPRAKGNCKAFGEGWACDRQEKSRGYCVAHYRQQYLGLELRPILIRVATIGECQASGDGWTCSKPSRSMGFCSGHYAQKRKGLEFSTLISQATGLGDRERVEWYRDNRSRKTESGCWEVTSTGPNGYRQVNVRGGKMKLLHVLSYEAFNGPTSGYPVHHKCAVPACFNPDHLQLVTQRENVAEMLERNSYLKRIQELEEEIDALKIRLRSAEQFTPRPAERQREESAN